MRFPYHEAHESQFELLVVEICSYLLGKGVQGFSSGPDGGRDARFEGTADRFPSDSSGLSGKFVVQAKHTENPCAKFSDSDFSSDAPSSVISKEIPRVRRLVEEGELDHYLLFSNRRLTANREAKIRRRILKETGAKTVELFGIERIDHVVKHVPDAMKNAGMSELIGPMLVNPDQLVEIIESLATQKEVISEQIEAAGDLRRVSMEEKNRINNMGIEFAQTIRKQYLKEFGTVRGFLAHPDNEELKERYTLVAEEFNELLIAHRENGQPFEKWLLRLQHRLFERDPYLAKNKRLTRLVIYYMYWICDLGRTENEP